MDTGGGALQEESAAAKDWGRSSLCSIWEATLVREA